MRTIYWCIQRMWSETCNRHAKQILSLGLIGGSMLHHMRHANANWTRPWSERREHTMSLIIFMHRTFPQLNVLCVSRFFDETILYEILSDCNTFPPLFVQPSKITDSIYGVVLLFVYQKQNIRSLVATTSWIPLFECIWVLSTCSTQPNIFLEQK